MSPSHQGLPRMGRDKADSVVDHRLRVHGIDGLRVIDASIFPAVTADLVLADAQ